MPTGVTINKFTNECMITVRISREMKIRMVTASILMRLAAWVMGCSITIEKE